jgi:hypothetical protein
MREPLDQSDRLAQLATTTSRRGFLGRVSKALTVVAGGAAAAQLASADPASGYTNFCGHTWTTGNCPHPTGLPRVDRKGLPLRAKDGHRVDDLGRPVNPRGYPVDARGQVRRDAAGRPLAPAPRTPVCTGAGEQYGFRPYVDGTWHRCCGGQVRRLVDCCAYSSKRINGDQSLTGYCYKGRKVFCVMYYETGVPC